MFSIPLLLTSQKKDGVGYNSSASNMSLADNMFRSSVHKKTPTGSVLDSCTSIVVNRQPSQSDLSRTIGTNAYFSDVNPKNMKRLMHIVAVTGNR